MEDHTLVEKRRIEAERQRLMQVWNSQQNNMPEPKYAMKDTKDPKGVFTPGSDNDVIDYKFYWHYREADCWISPDTISIPSIDRANTVFYDGRKGDDGLDIYSETEVFTTMNPYTVDEYHQRYCKLDNVSGKWIYN